MSIFATYRYTVNAFVNIDPAALHLGISNPPRHIWTCMVLKHTHSLFLRRERRPGKALSKTWWRCVRVREAGLRKEEVLPEGSGSREKPCQEPTGSTTVTPSEQTSTTHRRATSTLGRNSTVLPQAHRTRELYRTTSDIQDMWTVPYCLLMNCTVLPKVHRLWNCNVLPKVHKLWNYTVLPQAYRVS